MTLGIVGISEMQKCGLKYVTQNPRKVVGGSTNSIYLQFFPSQSQAFSYLSGHID